VRSAEDATASKNHRGVSFRAVLLGFLLIPLNALFVVKGLWTWGWVTGSESLFTNAIAVLFVLAVATKWLRQRKPAWAFNTGEMLTVYLVLSIGTGLTCSVWDVGGSVPIYATHAFWFATEQNGWRESLWPNIPSFLTLRDRDALAGLYLGDLTPRWKDILAAWAVPILSWTALIAAMMWVCLCLNSIVRRRWADEEKLAFPMVVLPVHLTDDRYGLLRNRLFWIGFAAAAGIGTWNIAATLVPSLPLVPTSWNYAAYAEHNPPWNFLRFYTVFWSPWYLGLAYLVPLDLAFSLFTFAGLWAAEYVVSGHFGWCVSKWSGFPYGEQQTAGGFIALGLIALWLDRKFLGQVLKRGLGLRGKIAHEEEEAFTYRAAVLGIVAGVGFLWWLLHVAGIPVWVSVAFFANYFLMCLVISRLRAQLGPPSHQLYGAMPNWLIPTLVGTRALGPKTQGLFYILRPLLQEQRNNPSPFQLEGLKMAEDGRMNRRRLAIVMACVPVAAVASYLLATIFVGYRTGMASGRTDAFLVSIGSWATEELQTALENPSGVDPSKVSAVGVSIVVTAVLYTLKLRFYWWPLHPVAYPIAMSNTIASITPALFATWLTKALLLRYGGLRAHRVALPFFLGLIAGDALKAVVAAVLFDVLGVGATWNPYG